MIQEGKSILKNWWYGAHILHKDKILHISVDARQGHSGMIILGEKVNSCLSVLQGFLFLAMLRIYQKTLPGMVQHWGDHADYENGFDSALALAQLKCPGKKQKFRESMLSNNNKKKIKIYLKI